jgi:1,4-dihydroxy-2-naphthoyl-CoA hydrolase
MPDLSPEALSPFLRGSSLVFDHTTRTEVTGTIDAGPDHHTPWGVVHGGLYATAVESTTSVGASLAVADQGMFAVGLSNQTDFIRAHTLGRLHVKAWPIHQGRTAQLWQCDITREDGKLVAQGRVHLQNVPMPSAGA